MERNVKNSRLTIQIIKDILIELANLVCILDIQTELA
jgi:hypothetical protein